MQEFLALLLVAVGGALLGTGAGIIPGLHVNNLVLLFLAAEGALLPVLGPPSLAVLLLSAFLVAAAVAHSIAAFVPSIFLGAPDETTALTVLPGHRLLREGRALEAVALATSGGVLGVLGALLLAIPLRFLLGPPVDAYEQLRSVVALILLLFAVLLVLSERGRDVPRRQPVLQVLTAGGIRRPPPADALPLDRAVLAPDTAVFVAGRVSDPQDGGFTLVADRRRCAVKCSFEPAVRAGEAVAVRAIVGGSVRRSTLRQRLLALSVFLLAGGLGHLVLDTPGLWASWRPFGPGTAQAALLPLFGGLFGVSTLLLGRSAALSFPAQDPDPRPSLPRWRRLRALFCGCTAAAGVSLFPGLSGGAGTLVARQLAGGDEEGSGEAPREFLFATAAVASATALLSVLMVFLTGRARSGAAAAVRELAAPGPWAPLDAVPSLLAALLLAGLVGAVVAAALVPRAARVAARALPRIGVRRLSDAVVCFLVALTALFTGPAGLLVLATATAIGALPPLIGVRRIHLMGCLIVPLVLGTLQYL